MRLRSLVLVGMASIAVFLTGGPSSRAENDTDLMRDPTLRRGGFFFSQTQRPGDRSQQRVRVAPVQARKLQAPVVVGDQPLAPKVEPSRFVVVIGDSLSELLAAGLDDALTDRPDVAVVRRTRSDSGLVRADYHDWPKVVRELVAGEQKITLAVMLLGTNDRQVLREGDTVHEPVSERWKEIYRQRIDEVAAAFAERRIPLLWVGAPPVQSNRLSADLIVLNDMFRQRVERSGGIYVDLWGGFIDTDNRYTATGPDLSGQVTRLRTADGVHFTRAGARKAAHFVDVAIRRLLENDTPQSIVALPPTAVDGVAVDRELQPGGIARLIDAMVSGLPDATRLAPIPVKPVAGPILPLNMPAAVNAPSPAAGETVLLARGNIAGRRSDAAVLLDRVFVDGAPPEPKPGRADDYRWPRPVN